MRAVLRRAAAALLLLIVIAVLVWGVTLWRWDSARRLIETRDIVLYLFFLPLCLWAMVLLARWAWKRSAAAPPPAVAATDPPPTPAAVGDDERGWSFTLLWQGLHSAAGSDAATVAQALVGAQHRPALDATLRDPDG